LAVALHIRSWRRRGRPLSPARLDRIPVRPDERKAATARPGGHFFAFFDIITIAFAAPVIATEFHVSKATVALLARVGRGAGACERARRLLGPGLLHSFPVIATSGLIAGAVVLTGTRSPLVRWRRPRPSRLSPDMKELIGSAVAATDASPERCLDFLEAIDAYPTWHPEVIKQAEVLERDAQGHPTKARCMLHVEHGPLKRDFNLVMAVRVDPSGTIELKRIPHQPTDPERFDVTWRVAGGNPRTRIRLDLAANLNVPRVIPLGGVGDTLAQGMVSAAARALASS
jgi:hypothetical protein